MRKTYIVALRTVSAASTLAIVITVTYQGHVMPWFAM